MQTSWIKLFKDKLEDNHKSDIAEIKMAKAYAPSRSEDYVANGVPAAQENGLPDGVLKPIVNVDEKLPNGVRKGEDVAHQNGGEEKRENGISSDESNSDKDANEKGSNSEEPNGDLSKAEEGSVSSVEQSSEDGVAAKKPPRAWAVVESKQNGNVENENHAIGGESQWPSLADSKTLPPRSSLANGSVSEYGNGTANPVKNGSSRVNGSSQANGISSSNKEEWGSTAAYPNGLPKAAGKKGRGGWRKLENHNLVVADARNGNQGAKIGWSSTPVSPQAEDGEKNQDGQSLRETKKPASAMRGKNGYRYNNVGRGGRGRMRDGYHNSPRANGEGGAHSRGGYNPRAGHSYQRGLSHDKYHHGEQRGVYKSRSAGSGMSFYPNENHLGTGMYYGHHPNGLMISQDDSRLSSLSGSSSQLSPMYPPSAAYSAELHQSWVFNCLQWQIEYYFSVENLCKDVFLRSQMDNEGFVKLELIRQFNRVRSYAPEKSHMIRCLENSKVVEVKDDKIRRKEDWSRWVWNNQENHTPTDDEGNVDNLEDVLVLVRSSSEETADPLSKPTDRIGFINRSASPPENDSNTQCIPYAQFRNKCLSSEADDDVVDLYNFWMQYLSAQWNKAIYDQFKSLAEDQALTGKCDGLKYLLQFYSNRLENESNESLQKDFIDIITKSNTQFKSSDFAEYALNKLQALRKIVKGQGRSDFGNLPPEVESALAAKDDEH